MRIYFEWCDADVNMCLYGDAVKNVLRILLSFVFKLSMFRLPASFQVSNIVIATLIMVNGSYTKYSFYDCEYKFYND